MKQLTLFNGEVEVTKGVNPTVLDYALAPLFNKRLISKRTTLDGKVVNSEKALRELLSRLALIPGVDVRGLSRALDGREEATLEQVIMHPSFIRPGYQRTPEQWQVIVRATEQVLVYYKARRRVNSMRKQYWEASRG